jgi:hypothetical protein
MVVDIGGQTHQALGALIVAAVPAPPESGMLPGTVTNAFGVIGDWTRHAAALAQFLASNPAYSKVVAGMVEVFMANGRLDGGYGPCPVHGHEPQQPG